MNFVEIRIEADSKYANISLNDEKTHLIIKLTKEFPKYAETETNLQFIIRVNFVDCGTQIWVNSHESIKSEFQVIMLFNCF